MTDLYQKRDYMQYQKRNYHPYCSSIFMHDIVSPQRIYQEDQESESKV